MTKWKNDLSNDVCFVCIIYNTMLNIIKTGNSNKTANNNNYNINNKNNNDNEYIYFFKYFCEI